MCISFVSTITALNHILFGGLKYWKWGGGLQGHLNAIHYSIVNCSSGSVRCVWGLSFHSQQVCSHADTETVQQSRQREAWHASWGCPLRHLWSFYSGSRWYFVHCCSASTSDLQRQWSGVK